MKKEPALLQISVCLPLSSDAAGKRSTKRGTIECKVLVFSLTFLQAQPTPDPSRRDQQKPASDQKVSYQKAVSQKKKGSNGCQRCGGAPSFSTGPCSTAPLSVGVVRYQRETHSQACHAEAGFDLDVFVTVWDEG